MYEPQYVDYTSRLEPTVWQPHGQLWYVVDEGDWDLKHSKPGDVGFDLPVIINAKNPSYLPKVQPHSDYYISTHPDDGPPWVDVPPNGSAEFSSGIRVKVPDDAWGNIKARSSTGWKKRLEIFEGTIDSGYVGPLLVLVFNPSNEPIRVHEGDRLSQLILIPKYPLLHVIRVNTLPETHRGDTGFGSSGGHKNI